MTPTRYICVCAEDFGMSEGINEAVFDLIGRHRLSAVGCMVRREFWDSGRRSMADVDPREVDVGLHLDLNFPEVQGGPESSLWELICCAYLGFLPLNQVRHEIIYQLDRFEDAMGRPPAFVDGHCHIHQLPGIREELMAQLDHRYRSSPPWLRSTQPAKVSFLPPNKANIIHKLGGPALLRDAANYGIPTSARLLGAYDFGAMPDYRAALAKWLQQGRTGDVLMCHPSAGDSASIPHGAARRSEYIALRETTQLSTSLSGGPTLAPLSKQLADCAPGSGRSMLLTSTPAVRSPSTGPW